MRRHVYVIITFLLATVVWGCGTGATAESIENARAALEYGDYPSASSICDEVMELQFKAAQPDVAVLCDLSIIYMKLADNGDRNDNVELARQCYIKAFEVDSAAAREAFDRLDVDDMPQGALIESIVRSTIAGSGNGMEFPDDGPTDSIYF